MAVLRNHLKTRLLFCFSILARTKAATRGTAGTSDVTRNTDADGAAEDPLARRAPLPETEAGTCATLLFAYIKYTAIKTSKSQKID